MADIYKPMSFYTVDKFFTVKKNDVVMTSVELHRDLNDMRRRYLKLKDDNKRLKKAIEKMKSIINGVDL